MPDQVPEECDARAAPPCLQALVEAQRQAFNAATVGRTLDVLLERPGRHPGQLTGKTPYLQQVQVEGAPHHRRDDRAGENRRDRPQFPVRKLGLPESGRPSREVRGMKSPNRAVPSLANCGADDPARHAPGRVDDLVPRQPARLGAVRPVRPEPRAHRAQPRRRLPCPRQPGDDQGARPRPASARAACCKRSTIASSSVSRSRMGRHRRRDPGRAAAGRAVPRPPPKAACEKTPFEQIATRKARPRSGAQTPHRTSTCGR